MLALSAALAVAVVSVPVFSSSAGDVTAGLSVGLAAGPVSTSAVYHLRCIDRLDGRRVSAHTERFAVQ
jgi:hypothetical protein